jgi:hypothetical protein
MPFLPFDRVGHPLVRNRGWQSPIGLALIVGLLGTAAIAPLPVPGDKLGEPPSVILSTNVIQPFDAAELGHAFLCLVGATVLGTMLAFRPRRAGGPPPVAHVTQAQIMMAIVGSLVMLIVGASLARAFAIAGTAGLVRYRAKIDNPKEASVMLACLAVGLASGVGLLCLAAAGSIFIVAVLWILEWREPWPATPFELKVSAKTPTALKTAVEALLTRHRIKFELREVTEKHILYFAHVPHGKKTDSVSEAITALHGPEAVEVAWDEKKIK